MQIMGIKDIARIAGVSISTVSRVLNGTKAVSPELEEKVRKAIAQESYVPNQMARSMVLQKTNLIGLILPKVSVSFHQKLFYILESILEKEGYKVIVCHIKDDDSSEISYLNLLKQKEVDGLILCHESYSDTINSYLNASTTPVVQCAINIPELIWPAFHIDAGQAVFDGISYMISLGHKNIGFICGDAIENDSSDPQIHGYRSALKTAGLSYTPDYVIPGSFSFQSGKDVTADLISRNPDLTAIFYVSDEMAVGGYRAITESGYHVGREIDVMGYDGIDLGEFIEPDLATIRQPLDRIAQLSIRTLLGFIDSRESDFSGYMEKSEVLPHEIRRGKSCSGLGRHKD